MVGVEEKERAVGYPADLSVYKPSDIAHMAVGVMSYGFFVFEFVFPYGAFF